MPAEAPSLVARGGSQPGTNQRRLLDLLKALDELSKNALEDIGRLLLIQPGVERDGINQSLIAIDQLLPSGRIATAAGQYQSLVARLHFISVSHCSNEYTACAMLCLAICVTFGIRMYFL